MGRFNYSGVAITGGTGRLNSSLGGTVLLKNGVVRNYVTPTNPQSEPQSIVRNAFQFLTGEWKNLTNSQRKEWKDARLLPYWAIQDPFTGTSRPPSSGKSLFILSNFNLLQSTDNLKNPSVVISEPVNDQPTDALGVTSVVVDESGNTFIVTYTGTQSSEVLTAKMTPPVSPGNMVMTSVKSKLRSSIIASGASPVTVTKPDHITFSGATGQKVFWVIEAINLASGKKRIIGTGNSIIVA